MLFFMARLYDDLETIILIKFILTLALTGRPYVLISTDDAISFG